MDAQAAFGKRGVPKMAVAIFISIAAALFLGGASGYVAKGLIADGASVHRTSSVVAEQPVSGGFSYRPQRSGLQFGDDRTGIEYTLGAAPTRPGGPQS